MFGKIWCRGWLVTDVWISTASILNLCAISVDRYVAVTRPVKYRSIMTARRAKTIVAGVWIVSFLICFPPLLPQWNNQRQPAPSQPPNSDYFTHNAQVQQIPPISVERVKRQINYLDYISTTTNNNHEPIDLAANHTTKKAPLMSIAIQPPKPQSNHRLGTPNHNDPLMAAVSGIMATGNNNYSQRNTGQLSTWWAAFSPISASDNDPSQSFGPALSTGGRTGSARSVGGEQQSTTTGKLRKHEPSQLTN